MLQVRNISKEIQNARKGLNTDTIERLKTLKHKIDTVKFYETSYREYKKWIDEYNELRGK